MTATPRVVGLENIRVVGLDLSLTATGLAFINGDGGTVRVNTVGSSGKATATVTQRYERVTRLAASVVALTLASKPDLVVLEQPAQSKGALPGQMDNHGLWWFVVHGLNTEAPVAHVSPSTRPVYATGKGNAGKDAVLVAVVRRYPAVMVTNNNEADALVLAAMGARWLGQPIDDPLPKTHLRAMTAPQWPC